MTEGAVEMTALEDSTAPWSLRIPPGVVAVVAVAVTAAALITFDLSGRAFVAAGFCAVLVVLAAVDLERRVVPNRIVLPAGAAVLASNVATDPSRTREWVIAAVATAGGAFVVAVATRGGLGMGDVKLCFLLGAGLGWDVVAAVVIGVFAGGVAAVAVLVTRGLDARRYTMPYAPFLALGGIITVFLS